MHHDLSMPSPMHSQSWDVLVIGAGVAGAAAAIDAARQLGSGDRVLLVEHAAWPRAKVCGCCLNAAAVSLLDRLDVLPFIRAAGAAPITAAEIRRGRWKATLPQRGGFAIARRTLDALLVSAATHAGAEFVPVSYTHLTLPTNREV